MTGLFDQYVVAIFTHGSFVAWCTDPMRIERAHAFVASPPDYCKPRPQDRLAIFQLSQVQSGGEVS